MKIISIIIIVFCVIILGRLLFVFYFGESENKNSKTFPLLFVLLGSLLSIYGIYAQYTNMISTGWRGKMYGWQILLVGVIFGIIGIKVMLENKKK